MNYLHSCTVCPRDPKHTFQNTPLCGIHFRSAIRLETCAVCLDNMDRGQVTQLECGHIMHTSCLSGCVAAACPLCRHSFGPALGPVVQHETRVKPLMESVYALFEPHEVPRIFKLLTDVSVCA
jgi:hypothetical protein